jgi:hypothetical protein
MRKASAGLALEKIRTTPIPIIEQTKPAEANASGRNISAARPSLGFMSGVRLFTSTMVSVEAMAMVAIIAPQ